MNTKFFYITFLTALFYSCSPSTFYQVYRVQPDREIQTGEEALMYEDEHCRVSYDLWSKEGNSGFLFYNKTNQSVYLELGACFFILNGKAYDYFQHRIFTNTANSGTSGSRGTAASKSVSGFNYLDLLQTNQAAAVSSLGFTNSTSRSIAYQEQPVVIIPAGSSKLITEFHINDILYRTCDLYKYPSRKQVRTLKFNQQESPVVFSNRIAYRVGIESDLISFENSFYISEITNLPENSMVVSRYDTHCGQRSIGTKEYFIDVAPDKFYIKYKKDGDRWRY